MGRRMHTGTTTISPDMGIKTEIGQRYVYAKVVLYICNIYNPKFTGVRALTKRFVVVLYM
jgi:hypothetical protein